MKPNPIIIMAGTASQQAKTVQYYTYNITVVIATILVKLKPWGSSEAEYKVDTNCSNMNSLSIQQLCCRCSRAEFRLNSSLTTATIQTAIN